MSKICKQCKSEIDSKAKICPNCRKKQGMPKWAIVLIVIFVIGIISAVAGGSTEPLDESGSSKESTDVVYNVGDTIKTNKYEISVVSVNELSEVGTQYFSEKPKEGATFIAVQLKFRNMTEDVISFVSLPSVKMSDTTKNTTYDSNGSATTYYELYNTDVDEIGIDDLAPGLTAYNSYVFEISKELYDQRSWELKINADKLLHVKIK